MQELLRRRVPQTVLAFFIAGWGLLQFFQFLEERYDLAPYVVDLLALGWVLLLPSVITLAWSHGAPDAQRWTRRQAAVISTNVLVAALVLGLTFGSRDSSATTTTTVTVQDENGQSLERKVAKRDYRHTVLLSFPLTTGLDESDHWYGPAFSLLLEHDLFQSPFVEVRSPWLLGTAAEQAGIDDPRTMPRALVADLAERQGADFYTVGVVARDGAEVLLTLELHTTREGALVDRTTVRGTDPAPMVDEASVWLREKMGVPRTDGDDFPDRPVADLISNVPGTIEPLVTALGAITFENDPAKAIAQLEIAIERDPTSCAAHMQMYAARLLNGQYEEGLRSIDAAMTHSYRMAERAQFLVRAQYYGARNEADKAMAVLRMWRELMPDDTIVHRLLASNHVLLGRPREAVLDYERLLELVPDDIDALRSVADLQVDLGDIEGALRNRARIVEMQPREATAHLSLAEVQRDAGDLDAARVSADQAMLLQPNSVQAQIFLADLEARQGRPEAALSGLEHALETSRGDHDRHAVISEILDLHARTGRSSAAIDLLPQWREAAARVMPPNSVALYEAPLLTSYVLAGRTADAERRLAELKAGAGYPIDRLLSLGDAAIALELGDTTRARAAVDALGAAVAELKIEVLRPRVTTMQAEVAALEGDPARALALCDSARVRYVTYRRALLVRAKSERSLERDEAALASLADYLRQDPAHPEANLWAARSLVALGRRAEARERIATALLSWSGADPDFPLAIEARALAEELRDDS